MTLPWPATFWVDRSDRTRLQLSGPDRAAFLHNLCTNDIKKLQPGQSVEAFITSLQGKTIGFVSVYAWQESLIVSAEQRSLDLVLPHFAKYGVFSDVEIQDVTRSTVEYHLVGRWDVTEVDAREGFPDSPYGWKGRTFVLGKDQDSAWRSRLDTNLEVRGESLESLRIATGLPSFGKDVTPENLPQELARDLLTISFVKGCYLGQETVARLDALGHVNKILRGLTSTSPEPIPSGSLLLAGEEKAGTVTSWARPFHSETSIALGMIRTKYVAAGTPLRWESNDQSGEVVVADLPMIEMAEDPAIS